MPPKKKGTKKRTKAAKDKDKDKDKDHTHTHKDDDTKAAVPPLPTSGAGLIPKAGEKTGEGGDDEHASAAVPEAPLVASCDVSIHAVLMEVVEEVAILPTPEPSEGPTPRIKDEKETSKSTKHRSKGRRGDRERKRDKDKEKDKDKDDADAASTTAAVVDETAATQAQQQATTAEPNDTTQATANAPVKTLRRYFPRFRLTHSLFGSDRRVFPSSETDVVDFGYSCSFPITPDMVHAVYRGASYVDAWRQNDTSDVYVPGDAGVNGAGAADGDGNGLIGSTSGDDAAAAALPRPPSSVGGGGEKEKDEDKDRDRDRDRKERRKERREKEKEKEDGDQGQGQGQGRGHGHNQDVGGGGPLAGWPILDASSISGSGSDEKEKDKDKEREKDKGKTTSRDRGSGATKAKTGTGTVTSAGAAKERESQPLLDGESLPGLGLGSGLGLGLGLGLGGPSVSVTGGGGGGGGGGGTGTTSRSGSVSISVDAGDRDRDGHRHRDRDRERERETHDQESHRRVQTPTHSHSQPQPQPQPQQLPFSLAGRIDLDTSCLLVGDSTIELRFDATDPAYPVPPPGIKSMTVTITLDDQILRSAEALSDYDPLRITLAAARNLPDRPLSYAILDAQCKPVRLVTVVDGSLVETAGYRHVNTVRYMHKHVMLVGGAVRDVPASSIAHTDAHAFKSTSKRAGASASASANSSSVCDVTRRDILRAAAGTTDSDCCLVVQLRDRDRNTSAMTEADAGTVAFADADPHTTAPRAALVDPWGEARIHLPTLIPQLCRTGDVRGVNGRPTGSTAFSIPVLPARGVTSSTHPGAFLECGTELKVKVDVFSPTPLGMGSGAPVSVSVSGPAETQTHAHAHAHAHAPSVNEGLSLNHSHGDVVESAHESLTQGHLTTSSVGLGRPGSGPGSVAASMSVSAAPSVAASALSVSNYSDEGDREKEGSEYVYDEADGTGAGIHLHTDAVHLHTGTSMPMTARTNPATSRAVFGPLATPRGLTGSFCRAVLVMAPSDAATLHAVLSLVYRHNANVLGLSARRADAVETCVLNPMDANAGGLDVVTGVRVHDPECVVVFLEGLARPDGGMAAVRSLVRDRRERASRIRESAPSNGQNRNRNRNQKEKEVHNQDQDQDADQDADQDPDFVGLFNQKLRFVDRAWVSFGLHVPAIKLTEPIDSLLQDGPKFYLRGGVPVACFDALERLRQLRKVDRLSEAVRLHVLPTATMLQALAMKLGADLEPWEYFSFDGPAVQTDTLTDADAEADAEAVASPGSAGGSNVGRLSLSSVHSPSRKNRTTGESASPSASHARTQTYRRTKPKTARSYLQTKPFVPDVESFRARREQEALQFEQEYGVAPNPYSGETNAGLLQQRRMRARIANDKQNVYTYSPDFAFGTVVKMELDEAAKLERTAHATKDLTSQGWRPAPHPGSEGTFLVARDAVSEQRRAELSEPWEPPITLKALAHEYDDGLELSPKGSLVPSTRPQFKPATHYGGLFESDSGFFRSVMLETESEAARHAEEQKAKEKAEWESKMVVESRRLVVPHPRGISQTDRQRSLLVGQPQRKALKYKAIGDQAVSVLYREPYIDPEKRANRTRTDEATDRVFLPASTNRKMAATSRRKIEPLHFKEYTKKEFYHRAPPRGSPPHPDANRPEWFDRDRDRDSEHREYQ